MIIEFLERIGGFEKGSKIELLSPVTVIAGPNGIGKSKLLNALSGKGKQHSVKVKVEHNFDVIIHHDFHVEDLKTLPYMSDTYLVEQMSAMSRSSGEGITDLYAVLLKKMRDKQLLLLDEPDRGMHLRTQRLMVKAANAVMSKHNNSMCLITAHGAGAILEAGTVLDMEAGKLTTAEHYLTNALFKG